MILVPGKRGHCQLGVHSTAGATFEVIPVVQHLLGSFCFHTRKPDPINTIFTRKVWSIRHPSNSSGCTEGAPDPTPQPGAAGDRPVSSAKLQDTPLSKQGELNLLIFGWPRLSGAGNCGHNQECLPAQTPPPLQRPNSRAGCSTVNQSRASARPPDKEDACSSASLGRSRAQLLISRNVLGWTACSLCGNCPGKSSNTTQRDPSERAQP